MDRKELLEEIQKAAAEYAHDTGKRNFTMDIRIDCENGWCSAKVINSDTSMLGRTTGKTNQIIIEDDKPLVIGTPGITLTD